MLIYVDKYWQKIKISLNNSKWKSNTAKKVSVLFFWSVFYRIRTEYGYLLCKSPYSVQVLKDTDQKKSKYGHFMQCKLPFTLIFSPFELMYISFSLDIIFNFRNFCNECFQLFSHWKVFAKITVFLSVLPIFLQLKYKYL